jgi:Transcription factor WhiB
MTAPLIRDDAGRFALGHAGLPDIPRTPRDGFHLRYDPAVERARRALTEALAALRPQVPPCTTDPDGWYPTDRHTAAGVAKAIEACSRCPLRPECGTCGDHESWGVWGGIDRDQTRRAHREWREQQEVPRAPRRVGRAPRSHNWPARALPVPCPFCHVAAGVGCRTADGAKAEKNHVGRKQAARSVAA